MKQSQLISKMRISFLFIFCKINEIQIYEDALTIRKEKERRKDVNEG